MDEKRNYGDADKMEDLRPPQRGLEGDRDSIEEDEIIQQDAYDDESGVEDL